jgi:hypothetical protein
MARYCNDDVEYRGLKDGGVEKIASATKVGGTWVKALPPSPPLQI